MVSKRIVLFISELIQDPTHKVHLTTHNTNLRFLLVQKIYSPFLFVFAQFVVTDLLIFILAGMKWKWRRQVFMIGHGQSRENSSLWSVMANHEQTIRQSSANSTKNRENTGLIETLGGFDCNTWQFYLLCHETLAGRYKVSLSKTLANQIA